MGQMNTRFTEAFLFGCGLYLVCVSGAFMFTNDCVIAATAWALGFYGMVRASQLRHDRLGPKSRDYEEWRAKHDEKRQDFRYFR